MGKITSSRSILSQVTRSRLSAARRRCGSVRRPSAAWSSSTNNRIPTYIPDRGISAEFRGAGTSVDSGIDGAALLDAGGGNFAVHADVFGRTSQDYRIPSYPYLPPPNPADAPNATQPGNFNGRQPNSSAQSNGAAVGASYIFNEGFFGLALTQNDALYHIPGVDGQDHDTRIDAHQTKLISKGEWRSPSPVIDTIRFWGGITDYKHNELGLADDTNPASDGVRQIFTNKEQEARVEAQSVPFDLRFASLTTAIGVQGGHQDLTAPSPDNAGLWDPNSNWRIASYMFNEFKFSETTKAQIAGRIEQVDLSGMARSFDAAGNMTTTPASPSYTPMSASMGLIQKLPWSSRWPHHSAIYRARAEAGRALLGRPARRNGDLRQGQSQSQDRGRAIDRSRRATCGRSVPV